MSLVKRVKGLRVDKEAKLAKQATRPQDMPVCVDCMCPIVGAAVSGYDSKWRCLKCNRIHGEDVLRESGDSAPNASEERPGCPAAPIDELAEKRRQARAKAILERYGVTRRHVSV